MSTNASASIGIAKLLFVGDRVGRGLQWVIMHPKARIPSEVA